MLEESIGSPGRWQGNDFGWSHADRAQNGEEGQGEGHDDMPGRVQKTSVVPALPQAVTDPCPPTDFGEQEKNGKRHETAGNGMKGWEMAGKG